MMEMIYLFIKEVAIAFATEGLKAGCRRMFRWKKKDPVLKAMGTLDGKMDYLISLSGVNSNATIREIAQQLNGLISTLHVRTAHDVLLKLRPNIPTSDQYSLSIVDYALGCCSRYYCKDSCMAEYDRAYREMIGSERYDPDIIAGKLYCNCLENKKDEALRMAMGLRNFDRTQAWAWIPELFFSENAKEEYDKLPDDIKANPVVLATSCMLHRGEVDFCVDIFKYQIQWPDSLDYENIPVWIFNLSILINRYIPEWDRDAFMGNTPIGPLGKELFEYSSRFIALVEKTELEELSKDIVLFNRITGYKATKNESTLEEIKPAKCSEHFLLFKQLSYALFLSKEGKYEEAKIYLRGEEIVKDAAVYNVRLFLSAASVDEEYAKETIHQILANNVQMPGTMLVYLLIMLKDYTDSLKEDASKITIDSEVDNRVYKEVLHAFSKEDIDTQYLLDHRHETTFALRPFVAMALFDGEEKEEALDLSKSCVRDGYVDISSHIYFNLLKQAKAYSRLNEFLRNVRESGFAENQQWLMEEYYLASKEEDFPRMLKIAESLYHLDPPNAFYFTCYMSMQYQNGHFDKVKKMSAHIGEYDFTPKEASDIFNVMLLSDLVEESVEFLYNHIRRHDPNEQLYLLYHSACINPKTSVVVRKEYDMVEEGLYVHYKHNDEAQSDIIVAEQRTACMIGKKKGEVVVVKDRMGHDETFEVLSIGNKYSQLLEEIYKAIHDGKLKTAFSFTMDDLTAEGNILAGLAKVAGHDEKWQIAHNNALEDYKKGQQSICAFFHGEGYIEELYNHLFGPFKVYNISRNDFEDLYEKRAVNIEEREFVLDMSSLILLYEIHLKFGIDFTRKFVVSQGIIHQIDRTIAREEYAMPAGIYQSVVDKLAFVEEEGESWFMNRLRGLKQWIADTMIIEQAHEMLEVDEGEESLFEKSLYLTLEYQSAALTMRGNRVFVSEDMAMTVVFGSGFPVADVNLYISQFHQDKYQEISHFFIESDIYGGDIDDEYMLGQYEKYIQGEDNSYVKCKENVYFCPNLYPVILNFCSQLMTRQIIMPGDSLTVGSFLKTMFRRLNPQIARSVFASAYRNMPQIRQELQTAFSSVYPLCI